ncbi:MAG: hypothetical protein OXN25_15600 [Candidatus Poribacteria bacterium]|nr:hypothetical protein [Candidatus Poribacteria bacterium]
MNLLSGLSLVWGILAILGMVVGFIPCLGSINYLNIPFAVFGLLFSVLALALSSNKEYAIAGCVLCAVAIFLGAIRLVLGFGIF